MRIATCNVRHGQPPWRRRPDHPWLVSAVSALDADVVGVQEVDRRTGRSGGVDQAALLAEGVGLDVRFGAAIDHDGGEYGVVIGVRGSIVASEVVRLPGSGEARVVLVAEVAPFASRRPWTIGCTHLSTDPVIGSRQLDVALDAVERSAGGSPAALLGDLNMGPERVLPVLDERGWAAARSGPTHPASRPRRRIDWIAVRSARVTAAVVPDLPVSDHRPVLAVVDADGSGSVP